MYIISFIVEGKVADRYESVDLAKAESIFSEWVADQEAEIEDGDTLEVQILLEETTELRSRFWG